MKHQSINALLGASADAAEAERPLFGALAATNRSLIGQPASVGAPDPAFDHAFDDWAVTRSRSYEAFAASRNAKAEGPIVPGHVSYRETQALPCSCFPAHGCNVCSFDYPFTPEEEADIVAQINGSPYLQPGPAVDDANPKDRMGALKLPTLSVIPSSLLLAVGAVMRLGASKYGRFNWRSKPVKATVYADAALRHLMSWIDGEDTDPESGESHLGHVAACMGILIDAKARGVLVDDRDVPDEDLSGTAAFIIRQKTLQAA